jgi:DinB family protein
MPLSVSMLTRLRHQQETLGELINGFTEEQLKLRTDPDKWSVFEQIAHLAAYQVIFIRRLERLEQEKDPVFGRYVAENDPQFPVYLAKSLHVLNEDITVNRSFIVRFLEGVDESALCVTGLHPLYGPLTTLQWAEFFLLHEAHHLFAIFKLTQALRGALRQ